MNYNDNKSNFINQFTLSIVDLFNSQSSRTANGLCNIFLLNFHFSFPAMNHIFW